MKPAGDVVIRITTTKQAKSKDEDGGGGEEEARRRRLGGDGEMKRRPGEEVLRSLHNCKILHFLHLSFCLHRRPANIWSKCNSRMAPRILDFANRSRASPLAII